VTVGGGKKDLPSKRVLFSSRGRGFLLSLAFQKTDPQAFVCLWKRKGGGGEYRVEAECVAAFCDRHEKSRGAMKSRRFGCSGKETGGRERGEEASIRRCSPVPAIAAGDSKYLEKGGGKKTKRSNRESSCSRFPERKKKKRGGGLYFYPFLRHSLIMLWGWGKRPTKDFLRALECGWGKGEGKKKEVGGIKILLQFLKSHLADGVTSSASRRRGGGGNISIRAVSSWFALDQKVGYWYADDCARE